MDERLIAPCGINCKVCVAYQFGDKDINKKGFNRKYCPGCIPRGKNCIHMGDKCELLKHGKIRFCFDCCDFPCKRLKVLDKRYKTKYHTGLIENLEYIKEKGMEDFLIKEKTKWMCPKCGGVICCHNGLCLACDLDLLINNKKYRWDMNNK